jgi:hypothetical protein
VKKFVKEIGPFALCVVVFVVMAAMPNAEIEEVDLGPYIEHPVDWSAMYGQDQIQADLNRKLGLL